MRGRSATSAATYLNFICRKYSAVEKVGEPQMWIGRVDWPSRGGGVNYPRFVWLLGGPMLSYMRVVFLLAAVVVTSSAQAQFKPVEMPAAPMVPAIPTPMPMNPSLTTPNLAAPSIAVPAAPSLAPAAPTVAAPAAPVESAPAAPVATQVVPPPPPAEDDSSLEAKCLCKDEDTGEEKCEISCCDKPDHSICVEPK